MSAGSGAKLVDRFRIEAVPAAMSSSTIAHGAIRGGGAEHGRSAVDRDEAHLGERQVERPGAGPAGSIRYSRSRPSLRPMARIEPSAREGVVRRAEVPVRERELGLDRRADPLDARRPRRAGTGSSSRPARRRSGGRRPATSAAGRSSPTALPATTRGSPGRPSPSSRREDAAPCRPTAGSDGSSGARRDGGRPATGAAPT